MFYLRRLISGNVRSFYMFVSKKEKKNPKQLREISLLLLLCVSVGLNDFTNPFFVVVVTQ